MAVPMFDPSPCLPCLQRMELARLALLVAGGVALVAARLALVGFRAPHFAAADNPAAHDRSRLTRALTFLYLPALNARLLLWPQQLSFDWSMDAVPRVASLADSRNALSAALYLGLWRCALRAWRAVRASQGPLSSSAAPARLRRAAGDDTDANNNKTTVRLEGPATASSLGAAEAVLAGLALLVLPLLPASNLFFYVGFVVAERVLYLPSVGFCLLVGIGAVRAQRCLRGRSAGRALSMLFALALAALAARTLARNADWHDEVALYRSGIDVNPAKGKHRPAPPSTGWYGHQRQAAALKEHRQRFNCRPADEAGSESLPAGQRASPSPFAVAAQYSWGY